MKARFNGSFEYGRNIARYLLVFSLLLCIASLFVPQGTALQAVLLVCDIALLAAAVAVMYRYCRCPYCGKHIMFGMLRVTSCPRCRRNLITGKKIRK